MTSISVTVVYAATGASETLPVQSTTTVGELLEWCRALFGLDAPSAALRLFKDGRPLAASAPTTTLEQARVVSGDLLAVQQQQQQQRQQAPPAVAPPSGGLDFSNLLQPSASSSSSSSAAAAPPAAGGLDFSSLLGQQSSTSTTGPPQPRPPVYWQGMNLDECMMHNPHPETFVTLLREKDHLFKELNYHNPILADKLRGQPKDKAVAIWREDMVKGGIQGAVQITEHFHKEKSMQRRLADNPDDAEAKEYYAKKEQEKKIQEQYHQMTQEYPESLGKVLMLYINAKINGHDIQPFCDSGAQSTIMSKRLATECGLAPLIDDRFCGTAVGVGTSKILGRIHIVQLQIGDAYYFPCSVTVMDDPPPGASEMPFLLGLDMMKRHTCQIDLERGCLKFRLSPGKYMETPFLHEKDLDTTQGGTKGFDADKANEELLELKRKAQEKEDDEQEEKEGDKEEKNNDGDDKMDVEEDDKTKKTG